MKQIVLALLLFCLPRLMYSQDCPQDFFWKTLRSYCGKSFEGKVTSPGTNDDFDGKRLVMHVRSCSDTILKIPFVVGSDRSRTWILKKTEHGILLKHDHRLASGVEDSITQYGGHTSNSGTSVMQFFPADIQTCNLIPYACFNVWWITVTENIFTYNLRRMGTDRLFTVSFDLAKPVTNPEAPWGWDGH